MRYYVKHLTYFFLLILVFMIISCVVNKNDKEMKYKNVRVSAIGSTTPQEVTIAVNSKNPLNLAAGANSRFYYYSFDGGNSWVQGELFSTLSATGDPAVTFDSEGNLYYSHLANPPGGNWLDRIVVQKSIDGGRKWNDGVGIGLNPPKHQDKEWIIADITNSKYKGNLYVSWTEFDKYGSTDIKDRSRIICSFSSDSAASWSKPVVVSDETGNCLDGDTTVEGAVPAVGPEGEVYISWSGPLGIIFDRSLDGGKTFGKDISVTPQPGGWDQDVPGIYRCNGMAVTVCDISNSPNRGSIYIVWSDQRNGIDDTDVFIIKSTDKGLTWGETVKVNDDNSGRHQFFPWVTVDPVTGKIYIVFYDRSSTLDNETDVYVAKSDNGGKSFTNHKVSELPFIPLKSVFFGDYLNIAAYDGMVYPIWARMDGKDRSIWMAIFNDK